MDAHVLARYFIDCRIFIEISVVFYSVNFSLKCSVFPHQNLCFLCFCSDSFHIENIQSRELETNVCLKIAKNVSKRIPLSSLYKPGFRKQTCYVSISVKLNIT